LGAGFAWVSLSPSVNRAARYDGGAIKLADKVVVVTGAGSGIGREVVLEALRRGAALAAVDVNPTTLDETASLAAAGARLSTHVVNIMDREAVEALPAAVTERHGTIDGIINCAGIIQPFVRLKDLDYEAIERVMAVNWSGTLYLTKTFLPLLIARPEGHIVNVSSMGGFLPVPGQAAYGASKAAVKLFTEALFAELQGTPVAVTVVFPGGVGTNITANSGVDMPNLDPELMKKAPKTVTPADAGRQIIEGLEKGAFRVLIGSDARFMDRFSRLSPRRATLLIANQMKSLLG
jgi:short-subunit dehydrogenase